MYKYSQYSRDYLTYIVEKYYKHKCHIQITRVTFPLENVNMYKNF